MAKRSMLVVDFAMCTGLEQAYEMLVEKHGALQRLARTRLEESAETVMREEEVLNLRDETADLTKQVRWVAGGASCAK
jgi:hypothetical protein